ncbi:adenylate kinase [Methanobrevibacter sp.]|uniref:adenylate kinase n=1 Tax=Methanobrevibacter sp. TaxID=66852 RepID=UPI0025F02C87|nr:adenylate kinase [Methanobrevibacter sp.]MBQ2832548.1 adenylate kinase [Methanobrevibacter sp.]
MKLVVLTGIPGSGSTTVLNKALDEVDYVHLNYGDIMTEIAIKEDIVQDRDELRKLPPETQKEIQAKAAKEIKQRSEKDNVIVDTHCTINTPSGFLPGLPIWVLEQLQPDLFILVEANPDEIIYRRLNDESRSRDVQKAKDIQLHQEMNRATSMAYATLTGATVKIIGNHDNHLNSTIAKLVNVLNL